MVQGQVFLKGGGLALFLLTFFKVYQPVKSPFCYLFKPKKVGWLD